MAENTRNRAEDNAPEKTSGTNIKTITPALVRQIADKVYALWRRDLQIERERWRDPRWHR